MIRVFLCDDVEAYRTLLRYTLSGESDIEVVGEAEDGEACIAGVRETQPDVILLDLAMPVLDGLGALPVVREVAPGAKVIALSAFAQARMARQVMDTGAVLYLEKGVEPDDIVAAVRAAGQGTLAAA